MVTLKTIAIFSPPLQIGGAERAVVHLANGFAQQEISVYLVLTRAQGPLLDDVNSKVGIVDLEQNGVFGALLPLSKFLRNKHPDILFSVQSHANIIALLARKLSRLNIPVVLNEQTTMSIHFALEPGAKNRLVPKMARLLYRQADAITCISQGVADDIVEVTKVAPERIERIYNPVLPALDELDAKIAAPLNDPWLDDADAPPVLLAVGRLTAAKDYPTLLSAFAQLRKKLLVNLIILGEGEKRAELEILIKNLGIQDAVKMPGFTSNPYAYMARCSVFVLSSAWEGLSNVLVEALACGAPIVATDCKSGPAEILNYGQYGVLTNVGNITELAKAIETVIAENKPDKEDLRERALDFSLDVITKQYLDLFARLSAA